MNFCDYHGNDGAVVCQQESPLVTMQPFIVGLWSVEC